MPDETRHRILIVDDEVAQMRALCDTLQDYGYEVVGATGGETGLRALRDGEFSLILTDLMMPGMDGISVLRAAKEIDPRLIGVVMTGHGSIDTAVEAMKAGALDYILKPFKLSIVLAVLARALAVRKLRLENEELMRRLQDRTAQLEAANDELESFSYSVSHDLRAPLRAIRGFSDILISEHAAGVSAEARRMLGIVSSKSAQMGRLIEDLLRFSQIGRSSLERRRTDIKAIVFEVWSELRADVPERAIEFGCGDLPECIGDAALLRQVVFNLLSNALKFTRGREPAVITVAADLQENQTIYCVQDNGAGFDMKHAKKLFGVFQRLHGAEQFEGTGVGLSIVQRIIKRHNGRVWAEGELGKGAKVFFALPHVGDGSEG